jgi:hypothetical protein
LDGVERDCTPSDWDAGVVQGAVQRRLIALQGLQGFRLVRGDVDKRSPGFSALDPDPHHSEVGGMQLDSNLLISIRRLCQREQGWRDLGRWRGYTG